jgi:hypothetical protein
MSMLEHRAPSMLEQDSADPRLAWAARRASEQGVPLEFAPDNIERIAKSISEPTPFEKLDALLLLLADREPEYGQAIPFECARDWPLILAKSETEAVALLEAVSVERHWIKGGAKGLRLTIDGRQQAVDLKSRKATSTKAFVAMWFGREMDSAYEQGFHPALYALGYTPPFRVDREEDLGKIDDLIVASIRKSALMVADFTGMRSGVFFEAGMGLGLGIPVVWTCRKDWSSRLGEHFDTRQYNHLLWSTPAELAGKLQSRVEATVLSRPSPREKSGTEGHQ